LPILNNTNISRRYRAENVAWFSTSRTYGSLRIIRGYLNLLCLSLLFFYLIFLPGGMLGFFIAITCLFIKLGLTRNIESLAVYMLLFGMKTFGMVTLVFGYPGIGGKAALVVGFAILFFFADFRKSLINLSSALLYFMWIGVVLFFFTEFHIPSTQL